GRPRASARRGGEGVGLRGAALPGPLSPAGGGGAAHPGPPPRRGPERGAPSSSARRGGGEGSQPPFYDRSDPRARAGAVPGARDGRAGAELRRRRPAAGGPLPRQAVAAVLRDVGARLRHRRRGRAVPPRPGPPGGPPAPPPPP